MTKIINSLPITAWELGKRKHDTILKWVKVESEEVESSLQDLCKYVDEKLINDKSIYMPNKDVYYIPSIVGLFPNKDSNNCRLCVTSHDLSPAEVNKNYSLSFSCFDGKLPSYEEVKKCSKNPLIRNGNYIRLQGSSQYGLAYMNDGEVWAYNTYDKERGKFGSKFSYVREIWIMPIYRLKGIDAQPIGGTETLLLWAKNGLSPSDDWLGDREYDYRLFIALYTTYGDYFRLDNDVIVFDEEKIATDLAGGKDFAFIEHTPEEAQALLESRTVLCSKEDADDLRFSLLQCDKERADLDVYDENILVDPNRGHWELWDWNEGEEIGGELVLPESWTARDPADDINHGIVGIDFGTKSTVVVYENENLQTLPLQVGSGNYRQGVQLQNYENPTVVQFIDIESFVKAYKARAGRPHTSWNDVTVSHTAYDNLSNSSSDKYYSFFDSIKQWCGTDKQRVKIKDAQGVIKDLPPFMDLVDGDINPVEIYAYYLGLYINNMLQEKHVFLQYIMSFPVTYDRGIREKMRRSFDAGIRKSLPTALLSNEEAMKQFIVQEGVSEPAAYAMTALEEFGFDPCGDDEVYYSVFDFGGGTTDFDFGVLRESELDRYDYTLIHFGANGDKTLGGENLLKLLAFEVFKANKDKLLNPSNDEGKLHKIPFTWAAQKQDFAGSEGLIKDSQEAHINMHNLIEELRPVWEKPEAETAQKMIDSGVVNVNLFADDGTSYPHMTLVLPSDTSDEHGDSALTRILQERIKKGIHNFFIALREAFDKSASDETYKIKALSDIDEIAIFLAGNSSKSSIVTAIFDEYIGDDGEAREVLGFGKDQPMPAFIIYPALGTEGAYKKQEEMGLPVQRDNLEKPTGKTGVAYGLLRCREGGNIKVVDITPDNTKVQFQYYIGRNKKRKFKMVIDRNTKMNQWYKFIDASASFDLLYTDMPVAATNTAPVTIARQIHVTIAQPVPDAYVYIRPVNSHTLEYAIAKNENELSAENLQHEPIAIELG